MTYWLMPSFSCSCSSVQFRCMAGLMNVNPCALHFNTQLMPVRSLGMKGLTCRHVQCYCSCCILHQMTTYCLLRPPFLAQMQVSKCFTSRVFLHLLQCLQNHWAWKRCPYLIFINSFNVILFIVHHIEVARSVICSIRHFEMWEGKELALLKNDNNSGTAICALLVLVCIRDVVKISLISRMPSKICSCAKQMVK